MTSKVVRVLFIEGNLDQAKISKELMEQHLNLTLECQRGENYSNSTSHHKEAETNRQLLCLVVSAKA